MRLLLPGICGYCDPEERELVEQAAQLDRGSALISPGRLSAAPFGLPVFAATYYTLTPPGVLRAVCPLFFATWLSPHQLHSLAGGAIVWLCIKSDSAALAKGHAELGRLQEVVRKLEPEHRRSAQETTGPVPDESQALSHLLMLGIKLLTWLDMTRLKRG